MANVFENTFVVRYDKESINWSSDPEINRIFLKSVHNYLADRLKARGHVFLNEVFDELGLPRTSQGQLVGWIFDLANPVSDLYTHIVTDSDDDAIVLRFVTQGVMYNKIEGAK